MSTRRHTPPTRKWVLVLEVMANYITHGPKTLREMMMWPEMREIVPSAIALKQHFRRKSDYIYRIRPYGNYGPTKYLISIEGINKLFRRGVISASARDHARMNVQHVIAPDERNKDTMSVGRYNRVVRNMYG